MDADHNMNSTQIINYCGHPFTKEEHRDEIFECVVCKEIGKGLRIVCTKGCPDFHVHPDCANTPFSLEHSFYPRCQFQFHHDRIPYKRCDACGGDIRGSMYHCSKNGKDLHPCCAKLSLRLEILLEDTATAGDHKMDINLRPKLSSKCFHCGHKKLRDGNFMSWGYSCKSQDNTIWYHVACAKGALNELFSMSSADHAPSQGGGAGGLVISRAIGGALVVRDAPETLQMMLPTLNTVPDKKKKNKKLQWLFKIARPVVTIILAAEPFLHIFSSEEYTASMKGSKSLCEISDKSALDEANYLQKAIQLLRRRRSENGEEIIVPQEMRDRNGSLLQSGSRR